MFRVMKFATPVVAFALLFTLTNLRASAADTATTDKGTISGTVVDKDGKPVADAHVRLFHPMEHAKR
jgi:protocatechuate 3,4-dioxygenase beta subunit